MTDKARELLKRVLEILNSSLYGEFELKEEIRVYLAEPEQDEGPVAWISHNGFRFNADIEPIEHGVEVALYLHPAPHPELVRLSDEEIFNLYNEHEEETSVHSTIFHFNEFARAIEARVLQREPLKKEQIEKGFQETGYREGESRGRCFVLGIRFAEKHHGIGGGDE